jgi:hypothetical protein
VEQQAVYQTRAAKTQATIEANARGVFAAYRSWRFAHRKSDNHPFFMVDGSPVRVPSGDLVTPTYYVDLHDCTCDSHRKGRVACKHMRAVRLWFEAVKRGEIVVYRRMTAGDRAALEADSLLVEELDVAEAADSLLDTYHEQQARRRASRLAEPEQDWWLTGDNGGIVWLQEGDRIGPDTAMERPVVPAPVRQPAPVRTTALRSYEDLFGPDDTEHS